MTTSAASPTHRTDHTDSSLRTLMLVARAAAVGSIILLLVLHIVSSEFDPASRWVSEYVLGDHPWLMRLAFLSMALGLLAITLLVHRALRRAGADGWSAVCWG